MRDRKPISLLINGLGVCGFALVVAGLVMGDGKLRDRLVPCGVLLLIIAMKANRTTST